MFNHFRISKQLLDKQQFFDIGCNSGSFVKSLSAFNIKNNVHCFEPHPVLSKKTKEVLEGASGGEVRAATRSRSGSGPSSG